MFNKMHISMNRKTIITTSWDDGTPLDLKLAKLLKKYEIPATFYVSTKNIERASMSPIQIREIAKDFDIGGHTVHHFDLTKVPLEMAWKEISVCKKELERIIDREVVSFCYPMGAYNYKVVEMVKKAGFKGARTINLLETKIKNPFEIGTTIHVYDHSMRKYAKELIRVRNPKLSCFLANKLSCRRKLFLHWYLDWYKLAIDTLEYVKKFGGIWHLRGHSWEIEKYDNWKKLVKIFGRIREFAETRNVSLMDNGQLMVQFLKDNRDKEENNNAN